MSKSSSFKSSSFSSSGSKSLTRIAAALALLGGALIATQAVSAYQSPRIVAAACDAGELARMGQLTRLSGQDASQDIWISKRGDLVRVSSCPALKDKLIAANS
ncbi:hypothetical protein SAMN05519103_08459 [Rhizobiales bacterium GAS113]|jgi:hypothetical protein|nr:hypothetical protein SAMN05519103_08459 [Rhizobiales bacterium GAS113]SEC90834.1 hypothetical protein SAMN05519104_2336 [Rhizobiales bacterium GAS188]